MACNAHRTAGALAFLALTALVYTPLGCGGAQDDYTVISQPSVTSLSAPDEVSVPKTMIRRLEACAKQGTGAHNEASYAVLFDVVVTPDGKVTSAKIGSSTLGDQEIESCMVRAFDDIALPASAFALRSSRPVSGGEHMQHSRDNLGIAQAAGGLVTLGPIVIAMGAAYILAQVTVQVVAPAIEAAIQRKKRERACQRLWEYCINHAPPQCLNQSAGKSFCTLCWERCNAGDIASPECRTCGF